MRTIKWSYIAASIILSGTILANGNLGWAATKKSKAKPAAAAPAATAAAVYEVDTKTTELRWVGKKVTGQHNGTIRAKSGQILVKDGAVTGGNVVIDMPSIAVSDLTGDSNGKLTGHLKSDDFFSVDKHPTAEYVITGVRPILNAKEGGSNSIVSGNLTIKGATHPLEFEAAIQMQGDTATAKASGVKIDRTLYNIRYGSGKFFENLGNKAIEDTFTLDFDIAAKKK